MIDLHSHLLPGVDDGSRSVEQSAKVLGEMARQGITDVCLTPHVRASRATAKPPADHESAFAALSAAVTEVPRLHRGAEIMLDRPLSPTVAGTRHLTLGGTRYVLVEFSRLVALETVTQGLARVSTLGLVPVLAHPERYSCCTVDAVRYWRERGARIQVDATTLRSSQPRGERARDLVAEGLADILAGDNHGDDRTVAGAFELLTSQGAHEAADLLTVQNPRAILDDRVLAPVPPFALRRTLKQRLRRLFEGEA